MDFRELMAYKKAFDLSMEIFYLTKSFPVDEKYSLTDQIRRSSRSVSANIAEAYRKRRYVNHFISKLTDSDAENSETNVWLEFSLKCGYINDEQQGQAGPPGAWQQKPGTIFQMRCQAPGFHSLSAFADGRQYRDRPPGPRLHLRRGKLPAARQGFRRSDDRQLRLVRRRHAAHG